MTPDTTTAARADSAPGKTTAPAGSEPAGARYGGDSTSPVDRFVWHPIRVEQAAPAPDALHGRRVIVIGGAPAARGRVGEAMRAVGAQVTSLDEPLQDAALDPDAVTAAARAAVQAAGGVDGIVDLGVQGAFEPARHERWKAALMRTTALLQAVYDDWAAETDATRCFYLAVTWMGGRMGYDRRGVAQPLGGVWAGIAKSLPQELPNCRVKVLDLAVEDAVAVGRVCVAEAGAWDYYEVGYHDGQRYTLASGVAPAPAPRLRLAAEDIVLMSGGARGVGFAFARKLAAEVGCRVVLTGRSAVPDPATEPWVALTDDDHAQLRHTRLREARPDEVAAVRRDNDRRDALRELARNLREAAAEGLPIEYRVCDFLDAQQVRALVVDLGERLRVVIHNAGIAAPTRLRRKPLETVVGVVESKLVSFVNLVEAVRDSDLDYFCNVGSVAGRMGGMIGQIDYSAANEVLSRLGFWAQQELGMPVATLCWTTWERIGLIANYDAALRYGAALKVEEGVERWLAELLGGEPTEAMFLGRIGTALSPGQIRGFLKFGDHPDLPWLLSRQHYLGNVEAFAPSRFLRARAAVRADRHPCGREFTIDGTPALPVSIALEYALSVGDWVAPEGWPILHLQRLRDVRIDLDALRRAGDRLELVKHGTGTREGGDWVVRVQLSDGDGHELVTADLVYADERPAVPAAPPVPDATAAWEPPGAGRLDWHGLAVQPPRWRAGARHVVGDVVAAPEADLWTLCDPPLTQLPVAAIEAILRATAPAPGSPAGPARFELDSVACSPTGLPEATVVGTPAEGRWDVLDRKGGVRLRCTGVRLA